MALLIYWRRRNDEGNGKIVIGIGSALARRDDFRRVFRFVARTDAASFIDDMALAVGLGLPGFFLRRRRADRIFHVW